MPTEEELEQRINETLDRERELENARAVMRKLDSDRLNEIFDKAVEPK